MEIMEIKKKKNWVLCNILLKTICVMVWLFIIQLGHSLYKIFVELLTN